tara:strand:+ start:2096 stop:2197 length:102 start_codon:yes stop_codon:yes gene_type:complete
MESPNFLLKVHTTAAIAKHAATALDGKEKSVGL